MKKIITFTSIILIILFIGIFIIYKNKEINLDNNVQNSNDFPKVYQKIGWLMDFEDVPKFPATPISYDDKGIYYVYYYENISYEILNNYFETLNKNNYIIEDISEKDDSSNNILKYEINKEERKIQIIFNKNSGELELLLYFSE